MRNLCKILVRISESRRSESQLRDNTQYPRKNGGVIWIQLTEDENKW